jgi:cyclase
MNPRVFAALLIPIFLNGASVRTPERSVTAVAEGVYVIRHPDPSAGWVHSNTTIVIGERGVLVVDACFLPSVAKEDVAEIRKLTSKPVRYLVNTHHHIDHTAGNSVYRDAFPDIEIIAHRDTKRLIETRNPGVAKRWGDPNGPLPKSIAQMKERLAKSQTEEGKPMTAKDRADTEREIADVQRQMREYAAYRQENPTLAFDTEMTVDLGKRLVRLQYLGRANTTGDAIAYLPAEKIVATGDILVHPVPYAAGGHPVEWLETLKKLAAMEVNILVPGHGEVLRDKQFLNLLIEALGSALSQIEAQIRDGRAATAADVKIDIDDYRKRMIGDDPLNLTWWNDMFLRGVVERGFLGLAR